MTPASVLSISQTFFRGYELCHGNGLPYESGKPNAIIPSIVCLALSVELALKAILIGCNDSTRGHVLAYLFDKLPADIQAEVMHLTRVSPQEFPKQLSMASNTFVKWRYIYEQNGFHTVDKQFLVALHEAVDQVAQRFVEIQRQALKEAINGNAEG
jgi:hypothetical protein